MTETKIGLDVSAWTGPISDETWATLRARGVQVAVVGLWHGASANPHALQQLAGAVHAGCDVAGYVALAGESGATGALQVSAGMTPVAWPTLIFLSPDVELASVTPDMLYTALESIRAARQRAVVYTGAWFWNWWLLREHDWFYEHPEGFKDCPAWLADYDYVPDLDAAPLAMLGPVVGKQFQGTTEFVPGCVVDLNVFDAAWLSEEEGELLEDRLKALERAAELEREKDTIRAALGAWLARFGQPDEGVAFWAFFGAHVKWRIEENGWTGPPAGTTG